MTIRRGHPLSASGAHGPIVAEGADPLGYAGRRVVVTGCASGIGAATARLLAAMGAKVHGIDRVEGDAAAAAFHRLDLGDPAAIVEVAGRIGGHVDALFNCAGLAPNRPWPDVVTVNLLGTRALTEAVLPLMGAGGAIVSVSSIGGAGWRRRMPLLRELVATEGFAAGQRWLLARRAELGDAYRLSKEALVVWTLAQSAVLMPRGIRMNCISPGTVQTPMLDEIEATMPHARVDAVAAQIGRRAGPEEQAWPLAFLNSPAASYVNGVDLAVDGGFAGAMALNGWEGVGAG